MMTENFIQKWSIYTSTQGAGAANGVGLPQDQSVGMGLRAQEIGVEMANALSQIKLNVSQAAKTAGRETKPPVEKRRVLFDRKRNMMAMA